MGVFSLSYLAGLLTALSPCVLPVVPLIVGSSLQRSRLGPALIALGLVLSFTGVGAILMATGASAAVSDSLLRPLASTLLIVAGIVLISKKLQSLLATLLTPLAARADRGLQATDGIGLPGQFLAGAMLGILWSPCIGPTMGATLALGAKGGLNSQVVLSMLLFGMGAATPIIAVAYGAQSLLASRRAQLLRTAEYGKAVFGVCIVLIGVITMFGADKTIEAWVLDWIPEWMAGLSTRY